MKKLNLILIVVIATICSCKNQKDLLPEFVKNNMTLVWSDEFDSLTNEPNSNIWDYKEGSHGWGNNEIQNYTKDRENSYISDGTLKIIAKKNQSGKWTSARLVTQYKKTFTYGYLEFRAKIPTEKGCWPALWLLPEKRTYGDWPRSGEIDIMESSQNFWGNRVYGTLHCRNGSGGSPIKTVGIEVKNRDKKFHTYAINWTKEKIEWYYDGKFLAEYSNPCKENDNWKDWPFDQPFHIIMNVAMGGSLGGDIDKKINECIMQIDYVRLYQ